MAFSLKKWIGSMLFSTFMDEYNENMEAIEDKFGEVEGDYASLLAGGEEYTVTLQNGWTGTLRYRKNGLGQVHIKGSIVSPSSVATRQLIATLPSGYRPSQSLAFNAYNMSIGRILLMGNISANGNIALEFSVAVEGQEVVANSGYQINLIYDTR